MKTLIAATILCISCSFSSAQEFVLFQGTWFHAGFIDALKKTSSLDQAYRAKPQAEPLWIRIDSTNLNGKIMASFDFGAGSELLFLKTTIPNVGLKWALGTDSSPRWIVSVDERQGTYIALTPIDSMDNKPIVLGRLPSKNPDPMFILNRMVNASVISGTWIDEGGKVSTFTNGMNAKIGEVGFTYQISIDSKSNTVTINATSGKPRSYVVQRMGDGLTLTPSNTGGTTMRPIVLKRKTP